MAEHSSQWSILLECVVDNTIVGRHEVFAAQDAFDDGLAILQKEYFGDVGDAVVKLERLSQKFNNQWVKLTKRELKELPDGSTVRMSIPQQKLPPELQAQLDGYEHSQNGAPNVSNDSIDCDDNASAADSSTDRCTMAEQGWNQHTLRTAYRPYFYFDKEAFMLEQLFERIRSWRNGLAIQRFSAEMQTEDPAQYKLGRRNVQNLAAHFLMDNCRVKYTPSVPEKARTAFALYLLFPWSCSDPSDKSTLPYTEWFDPIGKNGRLHESISNKRRNGRFDVVTHKNSSKKKKLNNNDEQTVEVEITDDQASAIEKKLSLTNILSEQGLRVADEQMQLSQSYRRSLVLPPKSLSAEELIKRYPVLAHDGRWILNDYNFDARTNGWPELEALAARWPLFSRSVILRAFGNRAESVPRQVLAEYGVTNIDGLNAETINHIGLVVLPTLCSINFNKYVQGKRRPRLNTTEVRQQLIVYFQAGTGVNEPVETAKKNKSLTQPLLLIGTPSGHPTDDVTKIYLVINYNKIDIGSDISMAVALLYASFWVFNLEYPGPLHQMYHMIERLAGLGKHPSMGPAAVDVYCTYLRDCEQRTQVESLADG